MRVKIVDKDGKLLDSEVRMNDIVNVVADAPADGEILRYNASNELWEAGGESDVALNNTHRATAHDYDQISGNDGATDVTAGELEELSDGSETALHSHAAGAGLVLTPYTNLDSDANAMLPDHAYKAAVAGWISFYVDALDAGQTISIYIGNTNNPVGEGTRISAQESNGDDVTHTAPALVAKDEYFECVRSAGAAGEVILFKGFDTLGNPVDQD